MARPTLNDSTSIEPSELLELEAEQQHGDRCRAWDEPAGQAEQHNLAGRDAAPREATLDVAFMRAFVRVHIAAIVEHHALGTMICSSVKRRS